jgi:oxygen-independent coproporphyrinogen-3 oxidase
MSGLYIHIPFCKKACHYCNFHFSTTLHQKTALLEALIRELRLRKDAMPNPLRSIYLGGGTPSLLSIQELITLFDAIREHFNVLPDAEITLEANPDDINPDTPMNWIHYTPINRISLGIQSFDERDLQWMNRAHNVQQATRSLEWIIKAGFSNWSADLIYGLPNSTNTRWETNIRRLLEYTPPHISAYCLTVEEHTALHHFVKTGKSAPVDEEKAFHQFQVLIDILTTLDFEHYEVSSFAKPNRMAVHNSSYWLGQHYLGIGPAAHSFDGDTRQWNVANNSIYIREIMNDTVPASVEIRTNEMKYNEYIMTKIRTRFGCQESEIQQFGPQFLAYFKDAIAKLEDQNLVEKTRNSAWVLTRTGLWRADGIAADLFVTNDNFE